MCIRDSGRLGVAGAVDQGDVEDQEAGHGDAEQPEPFGAEGTAERRAGPGRPDEQQEARHGVPASLDREVRRVRQVAGDRDAAADEDHAGRAGEDG